MLQAKLDKASGDAMKLDKASGDAIPKFQAKLSVSSLWSYEGLQMKLSHGRVEERS